MQFGNYSATTITTREISTIKQFLPEAFENLNRTSRLACCFGRGLAFDKLPSRKWLTLVWATSRLS